jgi:hypothetical protein
MSFQDHLSRVFTADIPSVTLLLFLSHSAGARYDIPSARRP